LFGDGGLLAAGVKPHHVAISVTAQRLLVGATAIFVFLTRLSFRASIVGVQADLALFVTDFISVAKQVIGAGVAGMHRAGAGQAGIDAIAKHIVIAGGAIDIIAPAKSVELGVADLAEVLWVALEVEIAGASDRAVMAIEHAFVQIHIAELSRAALYLAQLTTVGVLIANLDPVASDPVVTDITGPGADARLANTFTSAEVAIATGATFVVAPGLGRSFGQTDLARILWVRLSGQQTHAVDLAPLAGRPSRAANRSRRQHA